MSKGRYGYLLRSQSHCFNYPNSGRLRLSRRWLTTTPTAMRAYTVFHFTTLLDIEHHKVMIPSCNTNSKKLKRQLISIGMWHLTLVGLPCSRHLETAAGCVSSLHLHFSPNGLAMALCTLFMLLINATMSSRVTIGRTVR